jgi:hypothetical protein
MYWIRQWPLASTSLLSPSPFHTTLYNRFSWNKFGKMYSLEYTDIPKAFFTPHHWRWRQKGDQESNKFYNCIKGNSGILGHCCTNVIRGHEIIVETVWDNNDLGLHCCNSVHQQWPLFPSVRKYISIVTSVPIVATVTSILIAGTMSSVPNVGQQCVSTIPLLWHCSQTMTQGCTGCLVSRKNRHRQTDMDGPLRCPSFTLERE